MNKVVLALAVVLAAFQTHARADSINSISFQSLPGTDMSFGDALGYQANWADLQLANPGGAAGYGNASIQTWDLAGNVNNNQLIPGGSSSDIAFHYRVDFTVTNAAWWDFRIAPDFGYGGAVFLDNNPVAFNPDDMWWGGDWTNLSQLFTFSSFLSVGNHTLSVYGQELSADGPTAGEYDSGTGFTAFAAVPIPEPSSLLLLGTGIAAFSAGGAIRLRRQRNSAV